VEREGSKLGHSALTCLWNVVGWVVLCKVIPVREYYAIDLFPFGLKCICNV